MTFTNKNCANKYSKISYHTQEIMLLSCQLLMFQAFKLKTNKVIMEQNKRKLSISKILKFYFSLYFMNDNVKDDIRL